jgi:hypothetical protein
MTYSASPSERRVDAVMAALVCASVGFAAFGQRAPSVQEPTVPAGTTTSVTASPQARAAQPPISACDAQVNVAQQLLRDQRKRTPDEATSIHAAMVEAGAEATCAKRLGDVLAASKEACSHGTNLVSAAVFGASGYSADDAAAIIADRAQTDDDCMRVLVPNLQHAAHVSKKLVEVTVAIARSKDDDRHQGGWLTLGSLAFVARREGNDALAKEIDALVSAELGRSSERKQIVLVEAAGNGACEKCAPKLRELAGSSSEDVRRVAAGAFRFHGDKGAVDNMCGRLARDTESSVREHAAWGLGFRTTFDESRVQCLLGAAKSDKEGMVRKAAARSIVQLAGESQAAVRAVERMKEAEFEKDVREIAWAHLHAGESSGTPEQSMLGPSPAEGASK